MILLIVLNVGRNNDSSRSLGNIIEMLLFLFLSWAIIVHVMLQNFATLWHATSLNHAPVFSDIA